MDKQAQVAQAFEFNSRTHPFEHHRMSVRMHLNVLSQLFASNLNRSPRSSHLER